MDVLFITAVMETKLCHIADVMDSRDDEQDTVVMYIVLHANAVSMYRLFFAV